MNLLTTALNIELDLLETEKLFRIFEFEDKNNTWDKSITPLSSIRYWGKRYVLTRCSDDKLKAKIVPFSRLENYVLLKLFIRALPKLKPYGKLHREDDRYEIDPVFIVEKSGKGFKALIANLRDGNSLHLKSSFFIAKKDLAADKSFGFSDDGISFTSTERYTIFTNKDKRPLIPFAAIGKGYEQSRIFFYKKFLDEMNDAYQGVAVFYFSDVVMQLLESGRQKDARNAEVAKKCLEILRDSGFNIVNFLDDKDMPEALKILGEVKKMDGFEGISFQEEIVSGTPTLAVIYDEEWYQKNSQLDPYEKIHSIDTPVQAITASIAANAATIVPVVLKELAIKAEIQSRRFSLPKPIQWEGEFWLRKKLVSEEGENIHFFGISINASGSFEFCSLQEGTLFEELEDICMGLNVSRGEEIEAIIRSNKGDVGIILKTSLSPLPDIGGIYSEYKKYKTPVMTDKDEFLKFCEEYFLDKKALLDKIREAVYARFDPDSNTINLKSISEILSRGEGVVAFKKALEKKYPGSYIFGVKADGKKEMINSLLGIKYQKSESGYLYSTGISNANFKPDFSRNSIFRKILTVKGDELPLTILKMMDEYYVKNKELTVLPYPLKYIREKFKF